MSGNAPYIANLVNSIIGVSVLAMPYCMKKCGLLLGLGLLLSASWLTYISCSMLVTSAVIKRRRTYEYLAFYTVGPVGKFAVELSMIGLMLGTCVAFYIIIGDLATGILSRFVETNVLQLRTFVIVFCALCIALPLGLMKNLSALGFIGYFSLMFYCAFVVVMLLNSLSSGLLTFEWLGKVELFKPAGVFQSLPIFSLAYACQCQLFVVYDSLEEPSVKRMESIVFSALKIVTTVYCLVAIFGYSTFTDGVQGNVLRNLPPTLLLECIKLGFAVSVVVGFPLMIFPCRQSIYTLFFTQQQPVDGVPSKTYIEPFTFKVITLCIVLSTMTVAILISNVETILGLTGATMGSFICFIFPAIIYSKSYMKGDDYTSKFVFGIGCVLLVVCTYSNLYAASQSSSPKIPEHPVIQNPVNVDPKDLPIDGVKNIVGDKLVDFPSVSKAPVAEPLNDVHRHEPANPIEPVMLDHDDNDADYVKPFGDAENVNDASKDKRLQQDEKPELDNPPSEVKNGAEFEKHSNLDQSNVGAVPLQHAGLKNPDVELENNIPNKPLKSVVENNLAGVKDQLGKVDGMQNENELGVVDPKLKPEVKSIDEENKENELLDKIKQQHRMQSELLQQQEALINALEKEHDKEHLEQAQAKEVVKKEDPNLRNPPIVKKEVIVNKPDTDTGDSKPPVSPKAEAQQHDNQNNQNERKSLHVNDAPRHVDQPARIMQKEVKPAVNDMNNLNQGNDLEVKDKAELARNHREAPVIVQDTSDDAQQVANAGESNQGLPEQKKYPNEENVKDPSLLNNGQNANQISAKDDKKAETKDKPDIEDVEMKPKPRDLKSVLNY